jgi:hypothetical protein
LVVLRCIFWLVQICLVMTKKLFVSVFEGMLSLKFQSMFIKYKILKMVITSYDI